MRHRVFTAWMVVTAFVLVTSGAGCMSSQQREAASLRVASPTIHPVSARSPTVYRNERFGFEVPITAGYVAVDVSGIPVESIVRDPLVLIRSSDLPVPEATEGPPSITVTAYENPGARSAVEWAQRETQVTNFAPDALTGPHRIERTGANAVLRYTVAGLTAIDYAIVAREHTVVVLSASYDHPGDRIRQDFERTVAGIRFIL